MKASKKGLKNAYYLLKIDAKEEFYVFLS